MGIRSGMTVRIMLFTQPTKPNPTYALRTPLGGLVAVDAAA